MTKNIDVRERKRFLTRILTQYEYAREPPYAIVEAALYAQIFLSNP